MAKTPEQIRRETVSAKHYAVTYGFLGGLVGFGLCFGGWGLFHQEQIRRYPEYVTHAMKASVEAYSLVGRSERRTVMSAERLRYNLLRYGNQDHRFDSEIIRHGWYPKDSPASWVYENGTIAAVYSDSPVLVFKWPFTLSLFTLLGALIWGLVADYRYRTAILSGIPFDGSVVATVDKYNSEIKGDGMKYRVAAWKDR